MMELHRKVSFYIRRLGERLHYAYAGSCRQMKRLVKDEHGVSAVEFALLLPVMILIYGGVVDLSRGVETNKKINRVASVVGDLVSRQITVQAGELDDIFKIGATTMIPSSKAPGIKITFVKMEDTKVGGKYPAQVVWSRATTGLTRDPAKSRIDIPDSLRIEKQTYIKVEVQYTYVPFLPYVIPPINMSETYYISPRYTTDIPCNGC